MKKNFLIVLSSSFLLLLITSYISLGGFTNSSRNRPSPTAGQSSAESIGCSEAIDYSGLLDETQRVAVFEGKNVDVPTVAFANTDQRVLGVQEGERWVEVDISEQKLRAWQGDSLFLETPVSTGLPWWPTPTGEFRVWIKLRATKMEGGSGQYYYYLPNVPYVMFFANESVPKSKGYGLHGAYWHNEFGTRRSHGCVNLPIPVAEQLYKWSTPVLPEGKSVVYSSDNNPGMRIVIHE